MPDDVFLVVGILGQQGDAQLLLDLAEQRLFFFQLHLGQFRQLVVAAADQLFGLGDLIPDLPVAAVVADDFLQFGMFPAEVLHLFDVGDDGGVGHLFFKFGVNRFQFAQFWFKVHRTASVRSESNFKSRASSRERMPTST